MQNCVAGWGGLGARKEWMKRICPCFTPSRIALTESARETVSSAARTLSTSFFFSQTRDCTTLHDLTDFYVERVTAHHIQINYHVFTTAGQI